MTRPHAPKKNSVVELVNAHDDPYLLVRAPDETAAREAAEAWLRDDPQKELTNWREEGVELVITSISAGTWRWVPARPDDDYARYLHPAKPGRRGAFAAFMVLYEAS